MRAPCERIGAQLIFEEISSGPGETGRSFRVEHVASVPGAVVLGKALGVVWCRSQA